MAVQNEVLFCRKVDSEYPIDLKGISGMPSILYYRGNIRLLNQYKSIAVIGTRSPSDTGRELAYAAGKIIAEEKINLVNGLALGCDTEAIKGALAANGKCIAVLPGGLDQIVPKSNLHLAEEILEKGGCLLSEYPIGTIPKRYTFVERDRLQSGVSQCILVVESQEGSGTMHTAKFAMQQRKRLACYAHELLNISSGNLLLEKSEKTGVIKNAEDLYSMIQEVKDDEQYEQITLPF